jgi:transposase-like protein
MGIPKELKNRGVQDILPAAVDGLTGFPDAIAAVLPKTEAQGRIARLGRNSVRFVPSKDRKAVTGDLKKTYLSPSAELASAAPGQFAGTWEALRPMLAKSWRGRRHEIISFFKFSAEIRKAAYTANAIASVNYRIQKIIKRRRSFSNDEAGMKLIFMGLNNISKKRAMPIRDWGAALNQFAVIYGEDWVPL